MKYSKEKQKKLKMSWLGSSLVNQEGSTNRPLPTNLRLRSCCTRPLVFAREEHLERLSKQHDRIIP